MSSRRALLLAVRVGLALTAMTVLVIACSPQTTLVAVRSLERSGRVAFVCLQPSGLTDSPGLPLTDCTSDTSDNPSAFADDGGAVIPHIYGLVTQTARGEVAVVDLTARNASVIDEDPTSPGNNFLPIGANPVDVVSDPAGGATFVDVAQVGRPGIFALPSNRIRPATGISAPDAGPPPDAGVSSAAPQLSSWPACGLPSTPGLMIMIADPAIGGRARPSCDSPYEGTAQVDRQKLVVAMPELGGLAVIDAQTLLETPPGTFPDCKVERWLPLEVHLPAPVVPPPPMKGPGCTSPPPLQPTVVPARTPRPAGLAFANGRLYVADLANPVIHVVDVPTPCAPVERPPLLPTAIEDPTRVVTVNRVAVTPAPTQDFKRYLYAIDHEDPLGGSVMVFDVSDTSTSRQPIVRPHPELDPIVARDRLRLGIPVGDVTIIARDTPAANPATGATANGALCDPNPNAAVCLATSTTCDVGTLYRTPSTYDSGAGPLKLRGMFAFLMLTNGLVAVVDIEDFDQPCRAPTSYNHLFGCGSDKTPYGRPLVSTDEVSCNLVERNRPRDAVYELDNPSSGQHAPGLQIFPQLYDLNGTIIVNSDPTSPQMVAPLPVDHDATPGCTPNRLPALPCSLDTDCCSQACVANGCVNPAYSLSVGGTEQPIDPTTGVISLASGSPQHTLAMNLEDPRAQPTDQQWFATFEGPLPGLAGKVLQLQLTYDDAKGTATGTVSDPNSRFCDSGVLGQTALAEMSPGADPASLALDADYVQIADDLPANNDTYWRPRPDGSQVACTWDACRTAYGGVDAPLTTRDLRIVEAYQDHLDVELRAPFAPQACLLNSDCTSNVCLPTKPTKFCQVATIPCCFPVLPHVNLRLGNQWTVVGGASGFLHHVIVDPARQVCRNSCDPVLVRSNGRAFQVPGAGPLHDGDPGVFVNPMFRFAVVGPTVARDSQFRFNTSGSFPPVQIGLSVDSSTLVDPQSITYLPTTREIAVVDANQEGLIMVSTDTVSLSREFF